MRRLLPRLLLLGVGAGLSWLAIAISFEPLFVVGGSEPAAIWGPSLGRGAVAGVAGVLLLLAAVARGRGRAALLLLWLIFLATATHRIVEFGDGRVRDIWLGVTVRSLPADATGEPAAPRCLVTTWLARCAAPGGPSLVSPTPLPFAPLLPGRWEQDAP